MDNPRFGNEEEIPLVQDEDYDHYGTPNTSRVDETSFSESDTTGATSILWLKQKVKQDTLAVLYRHLNVTGNLDLISLDRFKLTADPKKDPQVLSFTTVVEGFLKQNKQVSFLHQKTLRDRFGGANTMKNF